jgi:hypothetical protein
MGSTELALRLKDQYKQFDTNLADMSPRERVHEIDIPPVPRLLWLDARQSFVFAQYVGSVLLSALSVEVSIREFLQMWYERKTGNDLAEFLESLDFRKAIELCRISKCFGDGPDEVFVGKLHKWCDIRTKYAHVKTSKILTEDWRKLLSKENNVGNGFPSALAALDVRARDDALETLRLAEEILMHVFTKSGFWYGKIGEP